MGEQHGERLPATHWTLFTDVCWPGRPDLKIDEVLAGPSGVHVVMNRARQPDASATVGGDDAAVETAAALAAAAASAVGELLGQRYRRHAIPAVCLTGTVDLGVGVADVLVASPDVLRHTWRRLPRVLSTSEAADVAARLRARLEPFPVEPPPAKRRWGWLRRRRHAPVAGAGAAGAVTW